MINFRVIARILGILLLIEGAMMLLSAAVSLFFRENAASPLVYSAIITIVAGVLVYTPLRDEERVSGNREGYIVVTGTIILFALFGTLPYIFSGSAETFTDAFFESISGFTTTGATIITDIDSQPKAILFWRSLTQWLGGIGVIFLSLHVLPVFRDLNIKLATAEFSGQPADKIHPRTADAVKRLIAIYAALTVSETILLFAGGMSFFDAVCHSLSTLSTGGFTNYNDSLSLFQSPFLKVVISIFMFIAGMNLAMVYFAVKRDFSKFINRSEFIFYSLIAVGFSIIISAVLTGSGSSDEQRPVLNGLFHAISILTTTGFYTSDYTLWGNFILLLVFILMFTGGMTGSASGGIKVARLLLMTRNNRMEMRRLIHPDAYIPVRFSSRIIPQSFIYSVLVFVTLYFLILCLSAFIISFMGYDIITSLGTAAAMLGNIGPGLGSFGPFNTYYALPDAGKWFMTSLMLLGRLELITVLILFSKSFYRK